MDGTGQLHPDGLRSVISILSRALGFFGDDELSSEGALFHSLTPCTSIPKNNANLPLHLCEGMVRVVKDVCHSSKLDKAGVWQYRGEKCGIFCGIFILPIFLHSSC